MIESEETPLAGETPLAEVAARTVLDLFQFQSSGVADLRHAQVNRQRECTFLFVVDVGAGHSVHKLRVTIASGEYAMYTKAMVDRWSGAAWAQLLYFTADNMRTGPNRDIKSDPQPFIVDAVMALRAAHSILR